MLQDVFVDPRNGAPQKTATGSKGRQNRQVEEADNLKSAIKFKDAVGRKFTFPLETSQNLERHGKLDQSGIPP